MSFNPANWRPSKENSWPYLIAHKSKGMYSKAFHKAGKKLTMLTRSNITGQGLHATGSLYKSVGYSTVDGVFSDADSPEDTIPAVYAENEFYFGVGAQHADYVEHGTGPAGGHGAYTPPLQAIVEWAAAKGLSRNVAFTVWEHIKENGTHPHPFMLSEAEIEKYVMEEVAKEVGYTFDDLPDIVIKVAI